MSDNYPILRGEKVQLRPIAMADTDLIVKWRNNEAVRKNFVFQQQFTSEMHQNWMNTKVKSGEVIQYIIEDIDEGKPIGSVYYRDIDLKNESAEFGIFIGEDVGRGKGYGKESTKLFVEYGFDVLCLHRISLRVFEKNSVAIKTYEKAGFTVEGVFVDMVKINNEYHNMVFMAKLN